MLKHAAKPKTVHRKGNYLLLILTGRTLQQIVRLQFTLGKVQNVENFTIYIPPSLY